MTSRRVLIVQNEAQVRDVLSRTVERAGYTVFLAMTGESAATMLAAQPVDGLILDLDLPTMTGEVLFHVVVSQWPELRRRIAITGDEAAQRKHKDWLLVHKLPVLTKPFRLAEVRRIVEFITAKDPLEANGL